MPQLIINSKNRTSSSSSSSDFIVQVRNKDEYKRMRFKQLILKHSIYPYESTDNIYWTISSTQYNVAVGFPSAWTGAAIATALQTALNSTGPGGFTVTYSSVTFKFTISNASAFTIDFSDMSNKLWKIMGFTESTDTSSATSHSSTNVAYTLGDDKIFLQSRKLAMYRQAYFNTHSFNTNPIIDSFRPIIMMIPLDVDLGDTKSINEGELPNDFMAPGLLDDLDLALVDDAGAVVTVNGMEWCIIFELY